MNDFDVDERGALERLHQELEAAWPSLGCARAIVWSVLLIGLTVLVAALPHIDLLLRLRFPR